MGLDLFLDMDQFIHERFIDMETPGRIDDDYVLQMTQGVGNGVLGNSNGILAPILRIDGNIQILSQYLQLGNSSRPVHVRRYQERILALGTQLLRQLGRCRRLAGALQPYEHDDCRRFAGHSNTALRTAQEFGQLIADNFDDCLRCIQTAKHLFADGFLPDTLDEVLGNSKIDICFQEGTAHLF